MVPLLTARLALSLALPLWSMGLLGQEPEPKPEATPPVPPAEAPQEPAPERSEAGAAEDAPRRRPRGRRARLLALSAAHVHPVAGPDIEDGIVLISGRRIVAVGKRGEIELPEGVEVRNFDGGHIYPGLVDAATDAFLDDSVRNGANDAATAAADALSLRQDREDRLVEHGITTAYTSSNRGSPFAGLGAVVRPGKDGVAAMEGKEKAALSMQLAAPASGTHALDRQRAIDGAFAAFRGLDDYRKKLKESDEALTKYQKDFDAYVEFHAKKNGKQTDGDKDKTDKDKDKDQPAPAKDGDQPATPADAPAGEGPRGPGSRGGRGRRGGRPGETPPGGDTPAPQEPKPQDPKPQDPKPQDPKPAEPKPKEPAKPAEAGGDQGKPAGGKDDKGPERPKFPKKEERDPQKDALLMALDGDVPLRVQVRRPDEIRFCLQASRERKIPLLVLEDALGAASMGQELADAGIACVLTNTFPTPMPEAFADMDPLGLPAALHRMGVPFAIASGGGRRAASLPLMAASAVGHGLPPDAALRAITLSAAEILGVQKDTGSLQEGKLADILVTDAPLLQSGSKALAVWSAGALVHDAQAAKEPR